MKQKTKSLLIFILIIGLAFITVVSYLSLNGAYTEFEYYWTYLCWKESNCHLYAVNTDSNARGIAQITPLCLADCNRIYKENYPNSKVPHWTVIDCYNEKESQDMFILYTTYWLKKKNLPITFENRARIWRGGPNGCEKEWTKEYWNDILELGGNRVRKPEFQN